MPTITLINKAKTFLLLSSLTALLLWVGSYFGGRLGFLFALFVVLLMNIISYWYSDRIVLGMYGAEELGQKSRPYKIIRELALKSGLPTPRVFIVKNRTPNAFATGRSPKKSAVAVTSGLLDLLDDNELRGVLAHELNHIRNRDTLIQTIAAVIAGIISYLAFMARWSFFLGVDDDNNLLGLLFMAIVAPVMALIIQMGISRSREYLADAGAAKLLGGGSYLIRALKKLEAANREMPLKGNPATAPLFIVNPFKGMFSELLSTHPPIEKRIAALFKLQQNL